MNEIHFVRCLTYSINRKLILCWIEREGWCFRFLCWVEEKLGLGSFYPIIVLLTTLFSSNAHILTIIVIGQDLCPLLVTKGRLLTI